MFKLRQLSLRVKGEPATQHSGDQGPRSACWRSAPKARWPPPCQVAADPPPLPSLGSGVSTLLPGAACEEGPRRARRRRADLPVTEAGCRSQRGLAALLRARGLCGCRLSSKTRGPQAAEAARLTACHTTLPLCVCLGKGRGSRLRRRGMTAKCLGPRV